MGTIIPVHGFNITEDDKKKQRKMYFTLFIYCCIGAIILVVMGLIFLAIYLGILDNIL